jgi:SAM-dependent methyltransferase
VGTADGASTATYLLDNAWRDARRRLELLERCHDPASVRRLEALGVGGGWRCLEAGAGAGSIARWLCSRVAPAGRVLAVDLDARFLEDAGWPCLEVRQANLVTGHLERDALDLVHGRMVLMHIQERERVLDRLIASLRPGGWLLLEEADIYPITATASGPYREMWQAASRMFSQNGAAVEWARNLPDLLQAAGLSDVGAESDTTLFPGASPLAVLFQTSMRQVREALLSQGQIDAGTLDEAAAHLDLPDRWFPGMAIVAAWGRRPE